MSTPRTDEGRELASEVIAAAVAFLTNLPARGWLGYETLRARRPHLIMVHLKGNQRRLERSRLHGQSRDRLSMGNQTPQPHRGP